MNAKHPSGYHVGGRSAGKKEREMSTVELSAENFESTENTKCAIETATLDDGVEMGAKKNGIGS